MPLCPNCGGFTKMDKKKTVWHCKRCDVGGSLNPVYHSRGQIEAQMKSQYPNPELKYTPPKS